MKPLLLPLPGNEDLARTLASALSAELGEIELRQFPDGESYVRIDSLIAEREVILLATLDRPNAKLLPLVFVARTARELGAKRVGLIAPYLAYMRQDRQFRPGEGLTSRYFARILSQCVDWLVTVDPHLHRYSGLHEIYSIQTQVVHAAPLLSRAVARLDTPVLIGPDAESEQWVAEVAKGAGAPYLVLRKTRRGDSDVEISVPNVERYRRNTPVLVDDIISTARTMIETVGHLRRAGLAPPVCIGVHAVFAGTAFGDLVRAGTARVMTSNTIVHESNAIDLSPLIADAARELLAASQLVAPTTTTDRL
jgi:ribose-phosphate pyrophosphokinase